MGNTVDKGWADRGNVVVKESENKDRAVKVEACIRAKAVGLRNVAVSLEAMKRVGDAKTAITEKWYVAKACCVIRKLETTWNFGMMCVRSFLWTQEHQEVLHGPAQYLPNRNEVSKETCAEHSGGREIMIVTEASVYELSNYQRENTQENDCQKQPER